MVIRNLNSLDPSLMFFQTPTKITDTYFSKLKYNNRSFIFQSDIVYFRSFEDNKLKILLSKNMFRFVTRIEKKIIEIVSENSEKWFNSNLTTEQIRQIYKSSLLFPAEEQNSVLLEMDSTMDPVVFSSYEKNMKLYNFKRDTPIILLARLKGITFYRSNCKPEWEFLSVKSKSVLIENMCLIDSEEETEKNDKNYPDETNSVMNAKIEDNSNSIKVINFENN